MSCPQPADDAQPDAEDVDDDKDELTKYRKVDQSRVQQMYRSGG